VHRSTTPIESLQVRRWSDLVEVIVPAGPLGVCGVYPDEGLTAELLQAGQAIRRAWVTDDVIVALNEPRDRLFVANANMPDRAGREVPISRLVGRSIQDACIVASLATTTGQGAVEAKTIERLLPAAAPIASPAASPMGSQPGVAARAVPDVESSLVVERPPNQRSGGGTPPAP
jgi:hypothetical protein